MKRYDVVVLGGGPAGSSAAFFLAEAGFEVALVEKGDFPRKRVCGEFVSATTFPVLDAIGVGAALRVAGGPPTRRVGFYVGDAALTAPMPVVEAGEGWGRTLARTVLDPALLEAARRRGATVYQPWKAVAMEREGGERLLTIESGTHVERLRARVVVAAHGSWEVGPLPTQPRKTNAPSDVLAFKAFFHQATFDDDLMILAAFPGGYGGMVHRDADTVGLSFCVRRDVLALCRERHPAKSAWESLLAHVGLHNRGVRDAVAGASLESAPRAAGPLRPGVRPRYADGVFRVGNAAGEAHPTIAEGISMAIQSGRLLADHLVSLDRIDDQGVAYARAWDAQFAGRIRVADAYARLCMSPVLAKASVPFLRALPGLLTTAAVLSGKTKTLGGDRRPVSIARV